MNKASQNFRLGAVTAGLLLLLAVFGSAGAQESTSIRLRLNRDFGTSLGNRIQGTFSLRVSGPDDLTSVVFYIDDVERGRDSEAPFRLQFRTGSYDPGLHTMKAVGITANGRELTSNEVQREFMSGNDSASSTGLLIAAILILVVGGRVVANWIANRGQPRSAQPATSGMLGGTICPNCGQPYALHVWGINLMAGRLDRCPHCKKWGFVRRASPQALQEAAEAMNEETDEVVRPTENEEERLRRRLDDSRFDDVV